MINKIKGYVAETLLEIKKVVWPDRRYVSVATVVVLLIVLFVGFLVTLSDAGLAKFFGLLLK